MEKTYRLNSVLIDTGVIYALADRNDIWHKQTRDADLPRMAELLNKYGDLNIGFVDASVIAVAERLDIKKIFTTDRRHFSIVQPKHCERLTALP